MYEPGEDCIGRSGVRVPAVIPVGNGHIGGDDYGFAPVPVLDDLLTDVGLDVAQGVAHEVDEHLLPRLIEVIEQRGRLHGLDVLGYVVAELGETVAVRLVSAVLLQTEPGCDMLAL